MISNILYLIIGLGIGITIMCLIQINRINEFNEDLKNRDDEIKNLKNQLLNKSLQLDFVELPNNTGIIKKELIYQILKEEEETMFKVVLYDKDGIKISEYSVKSRKDRDKFYDDIKNKIDKKLKYK